MFKSYYILLKLL